MKTDKRLHNYQCQLINWYWLVLLISIVIAYRFHRLDTPGLQSVRCKFQKVFPLSLELICLSVCQYVCMYVCLSVCLSVSLPVCLSVCLPVFCCCVCLSVTMEFFLWVVVCLSVSQSVYLWRLVCVSVFLLFFCLWVSLFSCASVCLFVCLFGYWFIIWLCVGPLNVTFDPLSLELKEDAM